ALEAALLCYARFDPAGVLALGGTAAASLAEAVNYRLVDWAAESPKVSALKAGKAVRWSIDAFSRAPFWTTAIVIFSPIPDSAVRSEERRVGKECRCRGGSATKYKTK